MKKVKCPKCLGTGLVVDQVRVGGVMRDTRKITLREAAKAMGITASHLSLLERGKRRWSMEMVRRHHDACR